MSVKIQPNAAPGTRYLFTIEGCSSTSCLSPAKITTLSVPPSPTKWVMKPYRTNFSKVAIFPTSGFPFATTFLASNDSIWTASEYSHQIVEIPASAKKERQGAGRPRSLRLSRAFQQPFDWCDSTGCQGRHQERTQRSGDHIRRLGLDDIRRLACLCQRSAGCRR